jgi:hypothetical protein
MATAGEGAQAMYGVSAGLDMISGVFGYLSSLSAQSIANSQADMIRTEAEANAQRYEEQAAQHEAQQKVMYSASGVTLAGSPIDALATSARIANENAAAIRMGGEREAANAEMGGTNAEMKGRDALAGGFVGAAKATGMGILAGVK